MRLRQTGRLCFVALVAIVATACASSRSHPEDAPTGLVNTIWMHLNTDWTHAPPEVESDVSTASATLVRFSQDHEFAMLHCVLYKTPDRVQIGAGDGYVVLLGEWSAEDGAVSASYRHVYETIRTVGGADTSLVQSGPVVMDAQGLLMQGQLYERAAIETSKYEEFIGVAKWSQRQANQ
jgi:hypothetical protein